MSIFSRCCLSSGISIVRFQEVEELAFKAP
jgi:hypothetical protein